MRDEMHSKRGKQKIGGGGRVRRIKRESEKDRKSKDWWVKGNNDNKVREWGKLKKEKE